MGAGQYRRVRGRSGQGHHRRAVGWGQHGDVPDGFAQGQGALPWRDRGERRGGRAVTLAEAEKNGLALQAELKAASLADLRRLPTDQFLGKRAGPIVDGCYIVDRPNAGSPVALMRGVTANDSGPYPKVEAAAFKAAASERYGAQAEAFLRLYPAGGDAEASDSALREIQDRSLMAIASDADSRGAAGGVTQAYLYLFTHALAGPDAARVGAFHTSDLVFDFDNLALAPNRAFTAADHDVAAIASGYWVNFIKTGDPNGPGFAPWPAYGADKKILDISQKPAVRPFVAGGSAALLQSARPPPPTPRG
jgi:para-nitrobenzyl esterase